jgi:beta-RFAP synthase
VSRLEFPSEWSILILIPDIEPGLHGGGEVRAFAELPAIPDRVTERLCRLVMLDLLPAVAERDLEAFGASLTELQIHVGRCFAPAQGGLFARSESEDIVAYLRSLGLHGVGQSSWGPALYAFSRDPAERLHELLGAVRNRFPFAEHPRAAFWTVASAQGSVATCGRLRNDPAAMSR